MSAATKKFLHEFRRVSIYPSARWCESLKKTVSIPKHLTMQTNCHSLSVVVVVFNENNNNKPHKILSN